jgi:NAD(P)-dependent dehydrogenase (short-subunit alcohol dehydrogenase family)
MKFDFKNKTVVITGGSSGIGLNTADKFLKLGANVSICGRKIQKLKEAKNQLEKNNNTVHIKSVDVTNKEEMFNYADEVEKIYGNIDIWISNAGIFPTYKIIDTPENVWDKTLDVNMKSIYYGGIIAKEKMGKKGGVLLNASSYAAIIPSIGSGVYAATKAAVTSMTRTLAGELAPYNIRVNAYAPGVIETEMTKETLQNYRDKVKSSNVQNKVGQPEDVSNVILFLASDYASHITGITLEISGGKYCVQNPNG